MRTTENWIDTNEISFISDEVRNQLQAWLKSFAYSKSTFLSYKGALNKLLSFLHDHNKNIQDLNDDDGLNLILWAQDHYQLSASSIKHFVTVANTIFEFLRDEGLILKNPLRLHKKSIRYQKQEREVFANTTEGIETFLDIETWQWLWNWLCTRTALNIKEVNQHNRDKFLFALLYHTGIRREEVTKLKMKHLFYRNNYWKMLVHGKGGKTRVVSINSSLLSEFFTYRISLGLEPTSSLDDETPMLVRIIGDRTKPYSLRAINLIITEIKEKALTEINNIPNDRIKAQINAMTTHWLRHTNATHRLIAGATLETTQDELGHSNPATTRIYTHTLDEQRFNDAEKFAELTKG